MDKISLRRLARERRRGIRPEIRERAGELLARSFPFSHPALAGARVVGGYLSLPGELPPEPLMASLHFSGRIVAVPAWDPADRDYVFRRWAPGVPLVEGPMRVLQPDAGESVPFESVDTVLVPGLAFDRRGNRLGFGAGWYDRILARCRHGAAFIGIAFDEQLFFEIPAESHDVRMRWLATPGAVLDCPD